MTLALFYCSDRRRFRSGLFCSPHRREYDHST